MVTPEGVRVEMVLAGLGSRFGAALVDGAIQIGLLIALSLLDALLSNQFGSTTGNAFGAVLLIVIFLVLFGYHVAFETLRGGRSPGKSVSGLQVVRAGGGSVTLWPSMVRNILRLVDFLPSAYLIGILAILASGRNQRVGDLAAGTVVIKSRRPRKGRPAWNRNVPGPRPAGGAWEASAVTPEEVAAVRTFLLRRRELDAEARARLGWELAERLRPKVTGADPEMHPEVFLEALVADKLSRSAT